MNYVLVDNNNIIINVIVYDGITPYDPSPYILKTTNNNYNPGDTFTE